MDVGEWETRDLVLALQGYIDSDDPIWPNDDRHYEVLTNFLVRQRPDPAGLIPLLGKHRGKNEVDAQLLKRDKIARAVVHSLMGRVWRANREKREGPAADQGGARGDDLAAVWDAIVFTGLNFSFEPVYEASHPGTGESLGEFFSDAEFPACAESQAAFEHYADALIARWRQRVTRKASSLFFGNLLRHLGTPVADRLYAEWDSMDSNERFDLLRRSQGIDPLRRAARIRVVNALLDDSYDVRGAAVDLLRELEAPLGVLDASAPDEKVENALPALRDWASKTES